MIGSDGSHDSSKYSFQFFRFDEGAFILYYVCEEKFPFFLLNGVSLRVMIFLPCCMVENTTVW